VLVSQSSSSPLDAIYRSDGFRLAWDNNIAFHVAHHAINLRKFRDESQTDVAEKMGTSQPAVARIEAGDHNITMETVKRLADALRGRIRFALEPREMPLPRWPEWWQWPQGATVMGTNWNLYGAVVRTVSMDHHALGAVWVSVPTTTERGNAIAVEAIAS
jgi:DNA-binding XRE family transcriptional regulator